MSYLQYWQLSHKPFEENCDLRFFYESDDHKEALQRLSYIVKDRNLNMAMLTGEVGCGKTLTKKVLESTLSRYNFEIVSFENSHFSIEDLLWGICSRITFNDPRLDFELSENPPERTDKFGLYELFRKKLDLLQNEENRHLALLFDEAQQISDETLDEIKNLTNISTSTDKYLTILLIGQPELRDKVRNLKQVEQRIFVRFHLNALDFNGTKGYILHRLRLAGSDTRQIFTPLALERIYRATGGIAREINRLCKLGLQFGYTQQVSQVSREDIEVICSDFEGQQ